MNGAWSTLVVLTGLTEVVLVFLVIFFHRRARRYRSARDRLSREQEVILGFVHDIGDVFTEDEVVDLDRFLERVLFYAMRTSHAGAGAVYMFEPGRADLRARAISGVFPPLAGHPDLHLDRVASRSQHIEQLVRNTPVRRGEGLIGEAADFGQPVLIENAEQDARVPHYADFLRIRSILVVPMRFQNRTLGVIAVINRTDGLAFSQENLNLLEGLAAQASVPAHYVSVRDSLEEKRRLDRDLEVAKQIQSHLLPERLPHVEGLRIAAFNRAAQEIGGDYYDVVAVDAEHTGIVIADVSGKGISGAILMASCRSVLRTIAPGCAHPGDALRRLNASLASDISEDMFISMLYMVWNEPTGLLRIARAGHEAPLLYRASRGAFEPLNPGGMAIGLADASLFDQALEESEAVLAPGDALVAYTDGITEAMNAAGEEWGLDQLRDAVRRSASSGADEILRTVTERLIRFVGGSRQYDDMTLFCLVRPE